MKTKKKLCWFYHRHTDVVGFRLVHIGGKMVSAPRTRQIAFIIQCKSCRHVIEEHYQTIDASLAEAEVTKLNLSLGENYDAKATASILDYQYYESAW